MIAVVTNVVVVVVVTVVVVVVVLVVFGNIIDSSKNHSNTRGVITGISQ